MPIILPGEPSPESWYVVARRAGKYVPMFPVRMPMCGSAAEALDRIRLTLRQDAVFSKHWDGWWFEPIPAEAGFQHSHRGTHG